MRKIAAILILLMGFIFPVAAQTASLSGPMDLVVLYDTSASMSDYYRETNDYLTGPFLREFLRIGDTFHLISFSKAPRIEISRLIEGVGDVEAVIGRILLMYPIDPESDIPGAVSFAEQYASAIPGNRNKKVILVSDGDNGAAGVDAAISAASARLSRQGTDLQYIRIPVTTPPSSGRPAIVAQTPPATPQTPAQTPVQQPPVTQTPPATQQPPVTQPPVTQTPGTSQTTPGTTPGSTTPAQTTGTVTTQPEPGPGTPEPVSGTTPGTASTPGTATTPGTTPGTTSTPGTPEPVSGTTPGTTSTPGTATPPGTASTPGTGDTGTTSARTTPGTTPAPTPGTAAARTQPAQSSSFELPFPLIIALIILGLLLLGLLIFFATRRLQSSPNRVMAQAASEPADNRDRLEAERQDRIKSAEMLGGYAASQKKHKEVPKDIPFNPNENFENGPPMLTMYVEDQNTAIGRRNIHVAKQGYTYSVGGGRSDFLIFLVPIPPHIADVRFDGRQCTFIPLKSQFFPDIGSQQISNCIGRTIRVVSEKNYELLIRIERYEDPLKALNKLLHSIQMPG